MVKSSDAKTTGNNDNQFKGIRKRKWGKWVSEVRLPNSRERIWLGSYDTPEKAARAFDAAVFCLRGPTAKLNFPANPPVIAAPASLTPAEIQAVAAKHANEGATDATALVSASANLPEQERSESGFMRLLTADSGDNRSDFVNTSSYCNQFAAVNDFNAADFNEGFEFTQETFLWSF